MTEVPQGRTAEEIERALVTAPELSWALREVSRVSADVDAELARRLALRPLDHAALAHVMSASPPIGPAELSSRLGISSGSGTELVDRLEAAGHLSRRRDDRDRRRVALHATDDAVGRVLGELAPLFSAIDALATDLTEQEQAVVARYLRAAAEQMRRFTAGGGDAETPRG